MTHQKNQNDQENPSSVLGREPRSSSIRRADGSWNLLPLILGTCAVVVINMFLDRAPGRSTNAGIERPANPVTPKTSPAQPN